MSRRTRLAAALTAAATLAVFATTTGPRPVAAAPAARHQAPGAMTVPEVPTANTVMVGTASNTTPVSAASPAELAQDLTGASPALESAAQAFFAAGGTSLLVVPTADASAATLSAALAPGAALDAAFSDTRPSLLVVPEISALDQADWTLVASAAVTAATRLDILALMDPSQSLLAPVASMVAQAQAADPAVVDQVSTALVGQADALRAALPSPQHGVLYAGSLVPVQGGAPVPTAAVMAGITAVSDDRAGIWDAPAGAAYPLTGWVPQLVVDNSQQSTLNVAGVDVARTFPGQGTLMWGSRTLSADSEFRYVPVVRTYLWVQRSLQAMLDQSVFAPNTPVTWTALTSGASSFLEQLWSQGGLVGDKASDAYGVQMGLGTTMTSQDILDGYMKMGVQLDMVQPAEFLEMTLVAQNAT